MANRPDPDAAPRRRVAIMWNRNLGAAGRGPPEVELHAAGAAEGCAPPPPVRRVTASLDHAGASMGRQVLPAGVCCGTIPAFHALRSPAVAMPSRVLLIGLDDRFRSV